ncbi:unnamed protein product [Staurois parvus]|uniref:Death-inducer obliterator 1 n=1 Tax=Staurois parvus TaxID=386267 RepID=A0ABN9DJP3_9NEOB|nr:unnamed protein product [Staurois parvus]
MEEVPSALSSSVAFETELNLESLESSSPASVVDDKDQVNDEILKTIKPTSKEFRKTWGFRKTTIAKREQISDVDMDASESSQSTPSLRRSGRQPKRTERVEEFLTAVRRNRGRKINALEESSDRSCPVTDVETASEGSVESTTDVKTDPKPKSEVKKEEDDSSDSDGMTLKEIQTRLRSRRSDPLPETIPVQTVQIPLVEGSVRTRSANRAALLQQLAAVVKQEPQSQDNTEEEKPVRKVSTRRRPEAEIYDPNTLYCICRQPHNNRFMICCDRCEEWFHGDCVGITERRGQLLERDGEDYICPNCTVPQGHEDGNSDINKKEQSMTANIMLHSGANAMSSMEQSAPDQGIKGRIEKATHPTGKKKLKIFHPVEIPDFAEMSTEVCETTAVSEVSTTSSEPSQSQDVAKCIGPGCSNLALRDSVYCSHDCILKHAAETMKSLSASKDAKPKEKVKVKIEKKSPPPKSQAPSKPTLVQKASAEKTEIHKHSVVITPKVETEGSSDEPSEYGSSTPSWESDHNYIAVKPEKTAAISSTLFYKSEKTEEPEKKPAPPAPAPAPAPVPASVPASAPPAASVKKPPPSPTSLAMKPISALPRIPMLKKVPISPVLSKQPPKQSTIISGIKPLLSLKPKPHPPPILLTTSAISRLPKIPKKIPPPSSAPDPKKMPTLNTINKKPASGVSPAHTSSTSAPSTSSSSVPSAPPKPIPSSSHPGPNNQIRQNIRRSLKEILVKRVNDSDDLSMSENEVGLVAINIEKEMFNLFKDTGSGYKSKYRTIMFNLKDPKNQGLFQRVVRGEISSAKLVRLKPEALASKRLSSWKEMESKTEQQEAARVPPPEKSTSALPDIFSSMLDDTTSQHRAHLFDLKCKICTGQISADDEPPSKRQKTTPTPIKKPEPKIKPEDEPPPPPEEESDTPMETSLIKDSILMWSLNQFGCPVPLLHSLSPL